MEWDGGSADPLSRSLIPRGEGLNNERARTKVKGDLSRRERRGRAGGAAAVAVSGGISTGVPARESIRGAAASRGGGDGTPERQAGTALAGVDPTDPPGAGRGRSGGCPPLCCCRPHTGSAESSGSDSDTDSDASQARHSPNARWRRVAPERPH